MDKHIQFFYSQKSPRINFLTQSSSKPSLKLIHFPKNRWQRRKQHWHKLTHTCKHTHKPGDSIRFEDGSFHSTFKFLFFILYIYINKTALKTKTMRKKNWIHNEVWWAKVWSRSERMEEIAYYRITHSSQRSYSREARVSHGWVLPELGVSLLTVVESTSTWELWYRMERVVRHKPTKWLLYFFGNHRQYLIYLTDAAHIKVR